MNKAVDINVEAYRERARMTSEVYYYTNEGNNLFVQSACCNSPTEASKLHSQGQSCIDRADTVRTEFWDKYPQAYISNNATWMRKDHEC